jgi:hypothetical protein
MILYWPEGTGGRSAAGLYASGSFGPEDFCPPSALAHSRAMYGDVVYWRDPGTVALPMDAAFISELGAKGRRFAQTRELTCFKFNAAWRRDSYKIKAVGEQEQLLRRIESGIDFRHFELVEALQAVVSGRFSAVTAPPTAGIAEGEFVRRNRRLKGIDSRFEPAQLVRIEAPTRFDLSDQTMPFEWHALEVADGATFRWTGPSPRATIDLPVVFDRDLVVRIGVVHPFRPDLVPSVKLSMYGTPLLVDVKKEHQTFILSAVLRRVDIAETQRDFGITIDTGSVARPIDLGLGTDQRWLGIAIGWVELIPIVE